MRGRSVGVRWLLCAAYAYVVLVVPVWHDHGEAEHDAIALSEACLDSGLHLHDHDHHDLGAFDGRDCLACQWAAQPCVAARSMVRLAIARDSQPVGFDAEPGRCWKSSNYDGRAPPRA